MTQLASLESNPLSQAAALRAETREASALAAAADTRTAVSRTAVIGALKLALAAVLSLFFLVFYAMLPIASLGFLPVFFGCVSLTSSALQDLGWNDR